jgi:hypothetical protein
MSKYITKKDFCALHNIPYKDFDSIMMKYGLWQVVVKNGIGKNFPKKIKLPTEKAIQKNIVLNTKSGQGGQTKKAAFKWRINYINKVFNIQK